MKPGGTDTPPSVPKSMSRRSVSWRGRLAPCPCRRWQSSGRRSFSRGTAAGSCNQDPICTHTACASHVPIDRGASTCQSGYVLCSGDSLHLDVRQAVTRSDHDVDRASRQGLSTEPWGSGIPSMAPFTNVTLATWASTALRRVQDLVGHVEIRGRGPRRPPANWANSAGLSQPRGVVSRSAAAGPALLRHRLTPLRVAATASSA
jgi:hypothetical protein